MKTIIAGGRQYRLTESAYARLDKAVSTVPITEVVCGVAKGVDLDAAAWATSRNIPVVGFPAHWEKHGRAAGPIRNREMAEYAEALILFPGGPGTYNMLETARKAGLLIYDHMLKDMTTVREEQKP